MERVRVLRLQAFQLLLNKPLWEWGVIAMVAVTTLKWAQGSTSAWMRFPIAAVAGLIASAGLVALRLNFPGRQIPHYLNFMRQADRYVIKPDRKAAPLVIRSRGR